MEEGLRGLEQGSHRKSELIGKRKEGGQKETIQKGSEKVKWQKRKLEALKQTLMSSYLKEGGDQTNLSRKSEEDAPRTDRLGSRAPN